MGAGTYSLKLGEGQRYPRVQINPYPNQSYLDLAHYFWEGPSSWTKIKIITLFFILTVLNKVRWASLPTAFKLGGQGSSTAPLPRFPRPCYQISSNRSKFWWFRYYALARITRWWNKKSGLHQGCARLIFFRADSTLTHMTIQVTQLRLNSNPKLANLTQLRLNSKPKFTNLTQLWLNSFESELSQIWLTSHRILPNLGKHCWPGGGGDGRM